MARYIDADATLDTINIYKSNIRYCLGDENEIIKIVDVFEHFIKNQPTADVRESVHGEWIIEEMDTYELSYGTTAYQPNYRCNCCNHITESYLRLDEPIMPEDADFPIYCPHCGARMDIGLGVEE